MTSFAIFLSQSRNEKYDFYFVFPYNVEKVIRYHVFENIILQIIIYKEYEEF